MLVQKITVKDGQRAVIERKGRFHRLYGPGEHLLGWRDQAVEWVDLAQQPIVLTERLGRLVKLYRSEFSHDFVIVETGDAEAKLVYAVGRLVGLVRPASLKLYAKEPEAITVETVDLEATLSVPERLVPALRRVAGRDTIVEATVAQQQLGLLTVDGQLREVLQPGPHAYWTLRRKVVVQTLDLRLQTLEVQGQEILTKDRVGLRVNLTALWRVVDPERVVSVVSDAKDYLYKELQFALRKAIGSRPLEDVLSDKQSIDAEVAAVVADKAKAIGTEVAAVGVKDIILPGDMRALMNRVIEAEKTAQANVIRRREETAATRSLLNTAQLLQDNPLTLRLKELESLERIAERIGHLQVSDGLDGLLKLVKLTPDAAAVK